MRWWFLTLGYSGLSRYAPGTVGSFVALIIGVVLLNILPNSEIYTPQSTIFLLAIMFAVVATKEIDKYEKESNTHDDKRIVIDELVGMWIALGISSATPLQIILSFIFFRYLDIKKPSIIGRADKMAGGVGVVLDDVLAGFFAGLLSGLTYKILNYSF
jgi:phosphatidylglycerophosphatase A